MAIYKSKHASNYTVLPNEVFKSKLSIEAIGLLAYFLSLPQDWVIYKTTLHTHLNIGRDKLNKDFDELRDSGYVISVEKRDNGKISYEHIVYDTPYNGEPLTGKPLTEKPLTAEQQLLNTNKPIKHKQKKEIQIPAYEEFLKYALQKDSTVDKQNLKLKYQAWIENNWNDGFGKKIVNWKSKLLNTLPHIPKQNNTQTSQNQINYKTLL